MLNNVIDTLKPLSQTTHSGYSINSMIDWLKSLRPQNWTKEDKERYISCLQKLSTGNPEQPETINSKWFKEHVYPRSTWKPSKEQMKALWDSIPENAKEISARGMLLDSLYQDLKKYMKGE